MYPDRRVLWSHESRVDDLVFVGTRHEFHSRVSRHSSIVYRLPHLLQYRRNTLRKYMLLYRKPLTNNKNNFVVARLVNDFVHTAVLVGHDGRSGGETQSAFTEGETLI